MSSIIRPPESPRTAGRPPDDVDGLLRAFFRSEVPVPWPPLAEPVRARPPVHRVSVAFSSRFALAGAVALFVVGYWSLSSRFPVETNDLGATINRDQTLGARGVNRLRPGATRGGANVPVPLPALSGEALEPTRNGGEALLQWEQLPDGLFMRIEEKRPPRR